MASHYKGERITELLNIIASMEMKLCVAETKEDMKANELLAQAYTTITLAKAKLTALQGEDK